MCIRTYIHDIVFACMCNILICLNHDCTVCMCNNSNKIMFILNQLLIDFLNIMCIILKNKSEVHGYIRIYYKN